jgi:hypothetical protein
MLMHNGDMDATGGFTLENEDCLEAEELGAGDEDNDDDANSGKKAIIEGGGVLCMNRRQTWTALVYLVSFPFPCFPGHALFRFAFFSS